MRSSFQFVLVIIPINCIIVISLYSVNQLLLAYHRRKMYFPSLLFLLFFLRFYTNLAQLTQVFICGRFRFCHRNGGEIRPVIWKIRHRRSVRKTMQNSYIFTSFAVGIFALASFRAHGFPASCHTLEFAFPYSFQEFVVLS